MSSKEITAIAIKFFSIYLLVNVILYFPSMLTTLTALENYRGQDFDSNIFIYVVGAFIILGVTVSFFLSRLANSIILHSSENSESNTLLSQQFLLQVLGVYFIVSGLSLMPSIAISAFVDTSFNLDRVLPIAGYIFQVIVGLYFLTKPVFWVQCLNKFRGRS
jgi:hypothetical protein